MTNTPILLPPWQKSSKYLNLVVVLIMKNFNEIFFIFLIFLFMHGCAPEVVKSPTEISLASSEQPKTIQIVDKTVVTFSSGYSEIIKSGSTWKLVGTIPQGDVYKIVDDVFIIEGAHIHEANIVINNGELVGYYLPALKSYSEAREPVVLIIK